MSVISVCELHACVRHITSQHFHTTTLKGVGREILDFKSRRKAKRSGVTKLREHLQHQSLGRSQNNPEELV